MKKLNIILSVLVSLSSLSAKNIVIDNLNSTKHINLSRSDTNRLVFPSQIKKQISSQEKDLLVTVTGNEMFVKFAPYREEDQVKVGAKTVGQVQKQTRSVSWRFLLGRHCCITER